MNNLPVLRGSNDLCDSNFLFKELFCLSIMKLPAVFAQQMGIYYVIG